MDSSAIEPGKDLSSVGPTLAAEMLKPPYRPKVAGKIAFFFGPVAGALVSVINLRRFGYPLKATRVLRWTLVGAVALAALLVIIPDFLARAVGFGAEIAFYMIYPGLQEREFDEWQAAHPEVEPLNGWKALGWGALGLLFFVIIIVLVGIALSMLVPSLVK